MLAALERLHADAGTPPFELTMAGGCQDEVLKASLDSLPDYVTWLGQIPQPALAELLRRSDIFVLPSYFEGLPLVLIEAMASGAVPVSTDLPGVKKLDRRSCERTKRRICSDAANEKHRRAD
jgi:glycosyltransferase involved in cell wall biosynthesis